MNAEIWTQCTALGIGRSSPYSLASSHEFPDGRISDIVDRIYADTEQFVCRDDAGKLIGAFRVNTCEPLPFNRFWGQPAIAHSMEVSRLVIDPLIKNPLKR